MKNVKKADEKNSLEQLLLRGKSAYEGNKTKTYQYILIVLAIVVVVVAVKAKFTGASGKLNDADRAYYSATQASFAGQGIADGELLKSTAVAYGDSVVASVLNADAGSAFCVAGKSDIVAKQNYSRGVKNAEGETKAPADPSVNFTLAYESYMEAALCADADVCARAYYGAGVAQENLAIVSTEDKVESSIEKAKEAYSKVLEYTDSPYYELAVKALDNLSKDLTVDYYKTVAKKFVTLPDPSDESILSDDKDELNVGESVTLSEDFATNDDSDDANDADSTTESVPVTEDSSSAVVE